MCGVLFFVFWGDILRKFEKISFEQFSKDVGNNQRMYDEIKLPKRSTKYSAGYDFYALDDYVLEPGERKKIPLGLKVMMNPDEGMMLLVRSSLGFKHNIRLCNQVGLFDCDYYNNPDNEGHMWASIQNEGDTVFHLKKGEHFVQGVFFHYLTIDDEEEIYNERTGGIGSTTDKGDE